MGKYSYVQKLLVYMLVVFSMSAWAQKTRADFFPKSFALAYEVKKTLLELKYLLDEDWLPDEQEPCPKEFECFSEIAFQKVYTYPELNYFKKNMELSENTLLWHVSDEQAYNEMLSFLNWMQASIEKIEQGKFDKSTIKAELLSYLAVDRSGYYLITDGWEVLEKSFVHSWLQDIIEERSVPIDGDDDVSVTELWQNILNLEKSEDQKHPYASNNALKGDSDAYHYLSFRMIPTINSGQKICAHYEGPIDLEDEQIQENITIRLITTTFKNKDTREYLARLMENSWNGPLSDTHKLHLNVTIDLVDEASYDLTQALGIQLTNTWANYSVDFEHGYRSSCGEIKLTAVLPQSVPGHELGHALFLDHPYMSYFSDATYTEHRIFFGDTFDIMMGGLYPSRGQRQYILQKIKQQK